MLSTPPVMQGLNLIVIRQQKLGSSTFNSVAPLGTRAWYAPRHPTLSPNSRPPADALSCASFAAFPFRSRSSVFILRSDAVVARSANMGMELAPGSEASDAAALTSTSGSTAQLARCAETLIAELERVVLDGDATRALGGIVSASASAEENTHPLHRALCDAVRRALERAGTGDGETVRAVALRATRTFADSVSREAPRIAADAAAAWCFERGCARVALVAGSALAARAAVAASVALSSIAVIDTGDTSGKALALALADSGPPVRYGSLAAAHDLLDDADALLIGAHEVAMNGAVVVSAGAAAVASLAIQAEIPVVVVVQAAKFSDAMVVGLEAGGRDVVKASEVDVIISEDGSIEPHMAPSILERYSARELVQSCAV